MKKLFVVLLLICLVLGGCGDKWGEIWQWDIGEVHTAKTEKRFPFQDTKEKYYFIGRISRKTYLAFENGDVNMILEVKE